MKSSLRTMKFTILVAATAAMVAIVWAVPSADAHGYYGRPYYSGARVGVYVGPGWGWGVGAWGYPGYPYPYPYYTPYAYPFAYSVPRAVVPSPPPVYVERGEGQADSPAQSPQYWWYYCWEPAGYYPYVTECPAGWQRVPPQAPPSR